jgi:hypothetical protein
MQAGQYVFSVMPPSTLPGLTVLGSPLAVAVKAGLADAAHSTMTVTLPPSLAVGSYLTVKITLADAYGNNITAPAAGQYNNSRLVVYGEQHRLSFWVLAKLKG